MLFALLLPWIFTFFILFLFNSAVAEGGKPTLSPPEVQLRSGMGGVYGRITYNGVPIHRARIILNAKLQGLFTLKEPSTYTDENGYYFLSNLSPGGYYLAAGWPNEKTYWFLRRQKGQGLPKAVDVQIEAGLYTLVPWLPLYVVIDLQNPSDGAITSTKPKFKWSENQYLQEYEFSLVRRKINADVLQGEIIFKRRPIKGTEFQPRKSLKPGIYWWTVSASSNGKTITATKQGYCGGKPIRLPREPAVSDLFCGNDFAVPSPSGEITTRETPSLILAVISPQWKKVKKCRTLSELYSRLTFMLHTCITTNDLAKLGGSKQARNIGETLLRSYGEKHSVGLMPGSELSMGMQVGICNCALVCRAEHPWQPSKGLKPSDIKIYSISEKVIQEMGNAFFYIKPAILPAGTYEGQREDVQTIGIYR